MNDAGFLCRGDRLVEGRFNEFCLDGDREPLYIVATRCNGEARAWINCCPHQARALNFAPDRFLTDPHGRLVCAHHGAVFERETGLCVAGPCKNARLTPVDLEERDGIVRTVPTA